MNITTILGPICSGKTYLIATQYAHAIQVDIGDIVREISDERQRIFDATLDTLIIDRVLRRITDAVDANCDIVIGGIRQLSILLSVEDFVGRLRHTSANITYTRIYLSVPQDVRRQRYIERSDVKDNQLTFSAVEAKEAQLGLQQLTTYCLQHDGGRTTIKTM